MGLPAWVQITPSQWNAMSEEQKQQVLMQAADDTHRATIEQAQQAREQNKPPSQDEELLGAIAGPGSLLGGYYLADVLGFGSGAAAAGGAGAGATGVAGAGVAGAGATTAATGAAAGGAGAAGVGATGAAGLGAAGTAGAATGAGAAGTAGAGSMAGAGSIALPALGAIYAGYRGWRMYDHLNDPGKGPMEGLKEGLKPANMLAFGLAGGPLVGGLLGLSNSAFGSKKNKDQARRDTIREKLKEAGAITVDENDKWNLTRADGTKYDIGTEDVSRTDDYQIEDFNADGVGQTVGWTDPLAALVSGGDKMLKEQYSGYFTNMALGSGDKKANVLNLYSQLGLDKDKAWQAVNELEAQGKIDQQTGHVYRNSLNLLFDGKNDAPTQKAAPQALSKPQTQQSSELLGGGVGKTGTPMANYKPSGPAPQRLDVKMPTQKQDVAQSQNMALAEALKPRKSPQDPNGSRTGVRMNAMNSPIVKQRALEYWLGRK